MIRRPTARVILLNPANETLLIRHVDTVSLDPARPDMLDYWCSPGGGVEDGETWEEAARRELFEETGILVDRVGPWVWSREHHLVFHGRDFLFDIRFYVARTAQLTVAPVNLGPVERASVREYRWWSVADLQASDAMFVPWELPRLMAPIAAGAFPAQPLWIA